MEINGEAQFVVQNCTQISYLGHPSKSTSRDGVVEDHRLEFPMERNGDTFLNADRQEVATRQNGLTGVAELNSLKHSLQL